MAAARVLLVEDDDAIGNALAAVLEEHGYEVDRTSLGAVALADVEATSPDVVLLDLGLPDMDGIDVCRLLRRTAPDVPIIVVTARDDEMDVIVGLNAGADDYLTKPFRLGELQARLAAVLRRTGTLAGRPVTVGGVTIDPGSRVVRRDGSEIELRPREFDLLLLLARNAGRVVERDRILAEVWRDPWGEASKTLDMHISTLRRRLGHPDPITTLRGVGYRLDAA
jgi:DNA-binding response OmpR family regulator